MRGGEARGRWRCAAALAAALALALAPVAAAADDVAAHGMPGIRVFRRDEGVPQSTVNAVAFEPSGRLWIGTQRGPAYHDGKGFVRLPLPDEDVSSNAAAIAAHAGAVWIGTRGAGLYRYENERFTRYTKANGLPSDEVLALLSASSGGATTLWAGTRSGLARLSGDRFERVDMGESLEGATVWALAEGELPSGTPGVWVGTTSGLARCEAGRCVRFGASAIPQAEVRAVLEAPDDGGGRSLWVGTKAGLARFTGGRWEVLTRATSPMPHDFVHALGQTVSVTGRRTLWIGTYGGGLARVQGGAWTVIDPARSTFPSAYVMAIAASGGGQGERTLWVATDGGGVARVRRGGFQSFTSKNAPFSGSGYVEAIGESAAPDGTAIWLGPDTGLLRGAQGSWTPVDLADAGLAGEYITSFARTLHDPAALWIGTGSGAIVRWAGGRLTRLSPELPPSHRSVVHSIREAEGGVLWATTNDGAARLVDGAWQILTEGSVVPGAHVLTALETKRKDGGTALWLATTKGLLRMEDGRTRTYSAAEVGSSEVFSLAEIREPGGARLLWIGTMTGGVARYDLDAETWRERLDEHSSPALPDNGVYQIRVDPRGRIYLFTNRGVARLTLRPGDPVSYDVYTFTTEDGLPADECTGSGALVDSRGRIWAGTVAGAAVLDPDEEADDRIAKPFAGLWARAGGRSLRGGEAIRWDESSVSFSFALESVFRERETRYRTQLVGFDEAPGAWSADGKARYTNLPPGGYTFQVWGRDYAGNVSGPASVSFRVRTAPWKTWPAIVGYVALALGLVYGGVRARLRALAEQNRKLEARVQERTRELDGKNVELGRKNDELDRRVAELARKNRELEASHARADRIFSALADVLPGTELDGKYRLIEQIGRGGYGAVFRARHLALERDVAVKVFRPSPGNDSANALARFQREGASASAVKHPNAVQVFDAGVSREGIVYLVMELLEGRSLAEELRTVGPISLARAARITVEMCGALAAAHAHGILHRDIKPENIFLHRGQGGETVKVVDFGIAKHFALEGSGDVRETHGLVGTPSYMAPERLKQEAGGAPSDVYSAGVTVYEMLARALPYPPGDKSLVEIILAQLRDVPVPLQQAAPHVPAAVADVVMRCIAKEPAERPGLDALAEALASVGEVQRDTAPAPPSASASVPASVSVSIPGSVSASAPSVDALGMTMDSVEPAKLATLPEEDPAGSAPTLEVPAIPRKQG